MTHKKTLRIETEDHWAWIVLNRPDRRNALNAELILELQEAIAELDGQASVRAVLITGEGKAFCAGLDLEALQQIAQKNFEENRLDSLRYANLLKAIVLSAKPVIAVVNGPAVAGGCGIVTACDLALAADSAKLGYPETRIGFVPAIVSWFLLRAVGDRHARDLLLTGRLIGAAEAKEIGLVNEVVAPSQLLERARARAAEFCECSPDSLKVTKALLAEIGCRDLDEALERACQLNAESRATADCIEGVAAFLEKRTPRWKINRKAQ
ncbi:MAG: enoyl-CoA hydratase-related protein [Acidobacteriota bacterium]